SLPWREAGYAALDFETTGLDYRHDAIVSYGVIPILGGRAVLAGAAHQLIRPVIPPSPRSQTVHLLRPKDLLEAPTIEQARRDPARGLRRRPRDRAAVPRAGLEAPSGGRPDGA